MRNLHTISPKLTKEELAVLAYIQMGNESYWGWQFKIGSDGRLWCMRKDTSWEPILKRWNVKLPLKLWAQKGYFKPDLSILVK